MPPSIRYDRDTVLNAAFNLARREGISALNARAVAREIGSSTQPIFRLYAGMDDLKNDVLAQAEKRYNDFCTCRIHHGQSPLLESGLSYLLFAKNEPELFKILFMRDRISCGEADSIPYQEDQIDAICQLTGYSREKSLRMLQWLSIFAHGLAVGLATKYLCFDEEHMTSMLEGAFDLVQYQMNQYQA